MESNAKHVILKLFCVIPKHRYTWDKQAFPFDKDTSLAASDIVFIGQV